MRTSKTKALLATACLSAGLLAGTGAVAAHASGTPTEDRQLATPAKWWAYSGLSARQVSATLTDNKARLTDIKVISTSPVEYAVTEVGNSGVYATSGNAFLASGAASEVNTYARAHDVRPGVLTGYHDAGGYHFAAAWVPNTGAAAKSWKWYYGTKSYLTGKVGRGDRVTSLARIQGTSYYTAVIVSNTGPDSTGWWWYFGVSPSQVSSYLSTNHARLVDLDRNDDTGTYNVIMHANPKGTPWVWYHGLSLSDLVARTVQAGQRLFDIERYSSNGHTYYAGVAINNLNALSTKLNSIIAPVLPSGSYGFYLRRTTSTATLAGLKVSSGYEPASALKVLIHAYLVHREALGAVSDGEEHVAAVVDENVDSCPDDSTQFREDTVANLDAAMMQQSDNGATLALEQLLGKSNVIAYGTKLGLTSTALNHHIGCPTSSTHNVTTLADLGKVYAAYINHEITSKSVWNTRFHDRMLNESNYTTKFHAGICAVINQEANSLGKSQAIATAFCNALTWAAKGGDYGYGDPNDSHGTGSHGGVSVTGVPRQVGDKLVLDYYVFGEWVDNLPVQTTAQYDAMNAARKKLYPEAMRPYVRAALKTWKTA